MKAISPIYTTKRPKLPFIPWPYAPVLELPAGDIHNLRGGKILTSDNFVLAVGFSPRHYLAVARVPGTGPVGSVLDQLIGFLHAHGATVVRTNLRAPSMWFADCQGDFSWRQCLVFFARIFLSSDPTDPPWVPPMIWPTVPLEVVASAGLAHWQKVNEVLEGVEAADPDLLTQLGASLAGMSRRWEYYTARMVVLSQRAGQYDSDDREMVGLCDRLLFSIMTRFQPDYELLPATISRLL